MSTFGLDKPTELPRWGTDQSNETEPGSTQKDTGWVFEQIPPSDFQNWLQRVTYDWTAWLNERLAPPSTGTGANSDDSLQIHDPATNLANTNTTNRGVVKLLLEGVFTADKVAAETITAFPGGSTITAAAATWQTALVAVNDIVVLSGTPGDDGVYFVSAIPAETQLTLALLDGASFTLNGGTPGGTATVKAKSAVKAVAPAGLEIKQNAASDAWKLNTPSDTFGGDKDWIFPSVLPSVKSFLTIDQNGQLAVEDALTLVTIGDGVSSFGQFEGTDETPFTDAIAALPNGGRIFVGRGTYTFSGNVTITQDDITIVGEGRDISHITGDIDGNSILTLDGDNQHISGLKITNDTNATANGAALKLETSATNCSVRGCYVEVTDSATTSLDLQALVIKSQLCHVQDNICRITGTTTSTRVGILLGDPTTRTVALDVERNTVTGNIVHCENAAGTTIGLRLIADVDNSVTVRTQLNVVSFNNTAQGTAQFDQGLGLFISATAGATARLHNNCITGNNLDAPISTALAAAGGIETMVDNTIMANYSTLAGLGTFATSTNNSCALANNFVATTSGGSPTHRIIDRDFQGT